MSDPPAERSRASDSEFTSVRPVRARLAKIGASRADRRLVHVTKPARALTISRQKDRRASWVGMVGRAPVVVGAVLTCVQLVHAYRCIAGCQPCQSTEPSALRALTIEALSIEQAYNVRYDGWGTVAVTK